MDIQRIEDELGVTSLKSHIILLLKESRAEAELQTENIINDILIRLKEKITTTNLNPIILIGQLIYLQKLIYVKQSSNINYYYRNYNFFSNSSLNSFKDDDRLVDFIIDNLSILKFSHIGILSKIKNIKTDFLAYYNSYFIEKKSIKLFDEINQLDCLPDFIWNLETIEKGILEYYLKLLKDIEIAKIEHKHEIVSLKHNADFELKKVKRKIEYLENNHNDEIKSLKNDIKWLNKEIDMKTKSFELYEENIQKYFDNQPILLLPTYFGDNQPFLFNLYNFLISNQLLKFTGWSYFYNCMTVGNIEVINLSSKKNKKFIARVFYCLQNFLETKFKTDFKKFIMNKFYIDEKPINENYFKNHMSSVIDETLLIDLSKVDAFFNKQREIYLKTK